MKKYMKILKSNIRINKNLFIFLLVLVLVGVASGAIFSSILNESDSKMVTEYLNNFLDNIKNNKIEYSSSLLSTSFFNMGTSLFIWFLGLSVIGSLLILPTLFIKSFILGFSVGSIMINFKIKGIIISLIYVVPHQAINILIYILISAYAIIISTRLFNSMKKREVFDFKKFMNRYSFILIFSLIVLLLTSLYEVFLLPKILNIVSNLIK